MTLAPTFMPMEAPPLPKGVEILTDLVPRPARVSKNKLAGTPGIFAGRKSTFDPKNPGKSQHDQWSFWQRANADKELSVYAFANEGTISASRFGKRNKYREVMEWIIWNIQAGTVAWVGWYAIDRATRDAEFGIPFVALCREHNVILVIDEDAYDPRQPDDEKRLLDMITTAQHMAARSRKNTLRGIEASALSGKPHGPECYGYRRIYNKSHELVSVEIVEEEAEVLREIAHRTLVERWSANRIAKDLNARGIRRKRGGLWHRSQVKSTLLCPSYRGIRRHTTEEDRTVTERAESWPAIFSPELAERIDRHYAIKPKMDTDTTAKYMLTGVIFCENPKCDGGNRMRRKAFYRTDKQVPPAYVCDNCHRQKNAADTERHVRNWVNEWLKDEKFLAQMAQADEHPELDALMLEAEKIADDMRPFADGSAIVKYGMDPQVVANTYAAYKEKQGKVQARIAQMQAALPRGGWARARETGLRELPADDNAARLLLKDLVVVWVKQSRRGPFDPTSIVVVPIQ